MFAQSSRREQGIPSVASVEAANFLKNPTLAEEVFGPYSLLIAAKSKEELFATLDAIPGQLTATIMGEDDELVEYADFIQRVSDRVGRVIILTHDGRGQLARDRIKRCKQFFL